MKKFSRRSFHRKVGEGMLTASLGASLAHELGISTAYAEEEDSKSLSFGKLDKLVALMEETPPDQLQRIAVKKLKAGKADLHTLMRAAALANARSFSGADYIGMHTLMAMKPAYLMAQQMPAERAPLAILKILHRNTGQIQSDDCKGEVMHPVKPAELPAGSDTAGLLNQAVLEGNREKAESILVSVASESPEQAFNDLLETIEENTRVHGVVFAHRSWEALDLVGPEYAATMLRQSLRRHSAMEKKGNTMHEPKRVVMAKLLDECGLRGHTPGDEVPGDDWVKEMSETIFNGTPENSACATASALKKGIAPAAIGEAISLAANQLVLRDVGRVRENPNPDKEIGSIHGDSIGVHASDSANAWRNMAKVCNEQNAIACLILGAYQASYDRIDRKGDFLEWEPRPVAEDLAKVPSKDPEKLLSELDGVLREENQDMACAVTRRYGDLGHPERPLLDVLLKYAISEDGALHGEKYYLTTTLDFADTRPALRWNHLVGLARVTASEYGLKSPGYGQACELLEIDA
jgi:hypothetical protein